MPQDVYQHTFPNGLTLLVERMEHVRSAAFNFLVPAGCCFDPPDRLGLGSILADMITRGAGSRDSLELSLALDNLGLDRSESVGQLTMSFWGSTLARNILPALEIYADILRKPHLPEDEVDAVKALALQDLQALEDDPPQKALGELKRRFWPMPLGRDRRGDVAGIEALQPADLRKQFERYFTPQGAILSIAGNVEWQPIKDQVEQHFSSWQGRPEPTVLLQPPLRGIAHIEKDTTQTQIGIAYESVPYTDAEYYAARGAVQVLSGGMGARLFTEVREKHGLCYSIWARHGAFKGPAAVTVYAGTTNQRAQETLDKTVFELKRLIEGVTDEEVQRAQAGLKSAVIMQEESTSARAGALASDWYYFGRVRSLEEVQSGIDSLTPAMILEHVKKHPPGDFTLVTLGPKALTLG